MVDYKNIIEGCLAGNKHSQELLYRRTVNKMWGVCLQYAENTDEAADILQEGYIKIFCRLEDFRFEGSFEGWMRKIIVNMALERYREKHHLYYVDNIFEVGDIEDVDATIDLDDSEDIEERELLEMISSLPQQYRVVFTLYVNEGFSHKEIGQKLGISENTSKSNLSRAREILRRKVYHHSHLTRKAVNS